MTEPGSTFLSRLLSHRLGLGGLADLPREHRQELQREGLWCLALSQHPEDPEFRPDFLAQVTWELQSLAVLRELAGAAPGLPIVAFKGCALAFSVYGPGQRGFGDLDLAVPAQHRAQFLEVLRSQGFVIDSAGKSARRERLELDLHQHPLHQLECLAVEDWFGETEPLDPRAEGVLRLSGRHEFILALFHGAKHAFSRLGWAADVALLAHHYDPALLARTVRQYRAGRHLWLAQQCLEHCFQLPLPAELVGAVCPPPRWDLLSRGLARNIIARRAPDGWGMLTPLWALAGWRARWGYLLPTLFPPGTPWKERTSRLWRLLQGR